jgi:VanZ family protein
MNLPKSTVITYRLLLITAVVVILYLATTSRRIPVVEDINDKVDHGIAFYALALLADFSFPRNGFGRAKALSLLGYGLAIEIIQYFLPYRSFSLLDLGADAVGLLTYGISIPVLKRMSLFNKRWE